MLSVRRPREKSPGPPGSHPSPPSGSLPPNTGGLSRGRRRFGLGLSLLGLPALTAALLTVRGRLELDSVLLIYLLAVVAIAVVGGFGAALLGALASFLLANWFLTPPYYTFVVQGRDRLVELLVFVVIAVLVSVTVDVGARNRVSAERNRMEARLLAGLTSSEIGAASPTAVLRQIRELFELDAVELVAPSTHGFGDPLVIDGAHGADKPSLTIATDSELVLRGYGAERFAEDSRLLRTLAETAARSWQEQRLAREAERAEQLAETDRLRAALLAAVSHDLRTPLAGIKAAVSSLRQHDVSWTEDQRSELLASIETSTDKLTELIANLLAMSRIQAGAVSVHLDPVAVDEIVGRTLIHTDLTAVQVEIPDDLPLVLADQGLLERVLANLLTNAARFSPDGRPVLVHARTGPTRGRVELDVIDTGPGVPKERYEEMFAPFQRLGDRDNTTGVGIGLAIARGFSDAMDTRLTPLATPGGGLTMRLSLPVAP
jgi:K+-sensing histidine kinase KdpD